MPILPTQLLFSILFKINVQRYKINISNSILNDEFFFFESSNYETFLIPRAQSGSMFANKTQKNKWTPGY